MTKIRQAELDQLVNDLAENMNLRRWKRSDLIDCINRQQAQICEHALRRGNLRLEIFAALQNDKFGPTHP